MVEQYLLYFIFSPSARLYKEGKFLEKFEIQDGRIYFNDTKKVSSLCAPIFSFSPLQKFVFARLVPYLAIKYRSYLRVKLFNETYWANTTPVLDLTRVAVKRTG